MEKLKSDVCIFLVQINLVLAFIKFLYLLISVVLCYHISIKVLFMYIGYNSNVIRTHNKAAILRLVLAGRAKTRLQLAEASGLTKMTVTNLVSDLLNQDIFQELTTTTSGKGRPTSELCLSSKAPKIIGVYLDTNKGSVVLCDLLSNVIQSHSFDITENTETFVYQKISESIDSILRTSINERIHPICVITPLLISHEDGSISMTGNSAEKLFIKQYLEGRYKLPSLLAHESDAAASLEALFGSGTGFANFIYISLGPEIRSSIVQNGVVIANKSGFGPSFGHVSIDYNGLSCACGNRGCLQSYVSTQAMEKKMKDITKLKLDFIGFCEMQQKKNDSRIDWALKDMMDKLGFAIVSIANILNIEAVIFGGVSSAIPDRYFQKLEKTISGKNVGLQREIKILKASIVGNSKEHGYSMPLLNNVLYGIEELK